MRWEKFEHHAFEIHIDNLKAFVKKSEEGDSMGGNEIVNIEKKDEKHFVIILRRKFSYHYVINQLREYERCQ